MSRIMRKHAFYIRGTEYAQLISTLGFASWIVQFFSFSRIQKFKLLAFCDREGQFVTKLVGNLEDRFSHNETHIRTNNMCFHTCSLLHSRLYICKRF